MRAFRVTVTMPDGSQGVHEGLYVDGFEAAVQTWAVFPQAKRVGCVLLPSARAAQLYSQAQRRVPLRLAPGVITHARRRSPWRGLQRGLRSVWCQLTGGTPW
jgi:hypothetical protein